jgi:WD40 repeat protein
VAFSPDGHYLVSASVDSTVRVYELGVQSSLSGFGHGKEVRAVALSPDGRLVASGGADSTVRLWDLATGKELMILAGHQTPLTALAFLPDSSALVSVDEEQDHTLKVWDVATGKERLSLKEKVSADVPLLTARPGNKQVLAWVALNKIETYDVATGKQVASLDVQNEGREVSCLAFSADGTLAAVGDKEGKEKEGKDGKVRIFDLATEKPVGPEISVSTKPVTDLAFTPDKKKLVTGDEGGEVKVWDLDNRAKPRHTIAAHKRMIVGFAMAPDGKRFATVGMDNVVKLWSIETGAELRAWDFKVPYQQNKPYVRSVVFGSDGKHLATANGDSTVYLLECPAVKEKEEE